MPSIVLESSTAFYGSSEQTISSDLSSSSPSSQSAATGGTSRSSASGYGPVTPLSSTADGCVLSYLSGPGSRAVEGPDSSTNSSNSASWHHAQQNTIDSGEQGNARCEALPVVVSSNEGDIPPAATSSGGGAASTVSVIQAKRRYRRHPKPDKNAPVKPQSAYIMFSNDVRAEMKGQNITFSDMAKVVGDRWKNLSHAEKQRYERTAAKAKDKYLLEMEKYRQTDQYQVRDLFLHQSKRLKITDVRLYIAIPAVFTSVQRRTGNGQAIRRYTSQKTVTEGWFTWQVHVFPELVLIHKTAR